MGCGQDSEVIVLLRLDWTLYSVDPIAPVVAFLSHLTAQGTCVPGSMPPWPPGLGYPFPRSPSPHAGPRFWVLGQMDIASQIVDAGKPHHHLIHFCITLSLAGIIIVCCSSSL